MLILLYAIDILIYYLIALVLLEIKSQALRIRKQMK